MANKVLLFNNFTKELNASKWKGLITELGIGIPFSAEYMSYPGASETILYVNSPYNKDFQHLDCRSVSEEAAWKFNQKLKEIQADSYTGPANLFYLTISGVHEQVENKTHGWINLQTRTIDNNEKSYMLHFRIRHEFSRREAGVILYRLVQALLEYALLGRISFEDFVTWHHEMMGGILCVDVFEAPDLTTAQKLRLVSNKNPMVFLNNRTYRVEDYLRSCKATIFSGSFNPPHNQHLENGKDALFLINFQNARKDNISIDDMTHRIKMLNLLNIPVMITTGATYFVEQADLISELTNQDITFVVGTDTFNAICNPKYVPERYLPVNINELSFEEQLIARGKALDVFIRPLTKFCKFKIYTRDNYEIVNNRWSDMLNIKKFETKNSNISSTAARTGNYENIMPIIASYIKEQQLYEVK